MYASTTYVNDPDDFLGTKLVLLGTWRHSALLVNWLNFMNFVFTLKGLTVHLRFHEYNEAGELVGETWPRESLARNAFTGII